LERNGAIDRADLGAVGEFIVRDEGAIPLNREELRRSITVLLYWPKSCVASDSCKIARERVNQLQNWVNESLKPRWSEENNPLKLVVIGEGALDVPRAEGWRFFSEAPQPGSIVPQAMDMSKPWAVVIDNNLLFAALEDLSQPIDFQRLERVLSKTTFDQYLGNYLSRRTFMGPKRHQN
jgi:hypothetical protein